MSKHVISTIPGDGIGKEVVAEATKVLEAAGKVAGIQWEWMEFPIGAERYLKTGVSVSDEDLDEIGKGEAILLGALGDPRVPEKAMQTGGVLKTRFHFDQYVNLRPIKLYPGVDSPLKDKKPGEIDFYVVRENSEDFYISLGDHFEGNEYATEIELNRGRNGAEAEPHPPG